MRRNIASAFAGSSKIRVIMADTNNRQETDSQRERRIGYAEFALAVKELTRLANAHETEIAVLKEQHRTMEAHIRALEALISQIGREVVTTRDSVASTVGSVQIAIEKHIASDERSQKFVLWSLLCFLILNGGALVGWLTSTWIGSGMPWPIFSWL